MADIEVQIVNPTASDITINADKALAGTITTLTVADSDLDSWIAAGCAVTSVAGSTFEQREGQGFLLGRLEADAVDRHAAE